MPSVVFVCVANSCRSQIAEAWAKSLAVPGWQIWSAGSAPSGRVHPLAIQLMQEVGLSLAHHRSKGLADLPAQPWDYVVTMGCNDHCPTLRATHRINWELPDPVGLPLEAARQLRDQIGALVHALLHPAAQRRDG